MLRKNACKVFCIGLILVIACNLLLLFYTKATLQRLILSSLQKELHLPLSEWNGTVIKRLSHLELDLQHLKETMKLSMKQQKNVDNTLEKVEAKVSEKEKHKPREKLFPDSPLFKQWGEDLSEAEQKTAQDLFQKFGYNAYLSNQLPLNRPIPDTRDSRCLQKTYSSQLPSLSVILIFMNEALSIIQRAIASVINRTPSRLLKEIILVDDFSSNGRLELEKYGVAVDGFNWQLWCRYDALPKAWLDLNDVTAPVKSPSIMGILAANRLFLGKIGSLDGGMLVYGGENVELSLR
ncbi:PREDICTED: probable polypeptide N-acetylgalactosaminyltransferase 8, partial [Hipposideros armiger]|uniref:Probable polypeptide N-acetylgalactosaminyltransferase 8 n=1 Tax=Hipposideros armiger TaxID=186990 RepID=A0A8B7ST09_HIPAR